MPDRFYCYPLPSGDVAVLEGPEAHHLSRVLRKSVGDLVELFDGQGGYASAEVQSLSKKTVELKLLNRGQSPLGIKIMVPDRTNSIGTRDQFAVIPVTESRPVSERVGRT